MPFDFIASIHYLALINRTYTKCTMKTTIKSIAYIALLLLLTQCEENNTPKVAQSVEDRDVYGVVQKGPFINGTTITISELDADFNQTGKVYSTQILDNEAMSFS